MNLSVALTIYFSVFFLSIRGIAQMQSKFGVDRYDLDTTVLFEEGTNDYDFVFDGPSQGFYWGEIGRHVDCFRVNLHITNNTTDTLKLLKIGGGDGSFIFYRSYTPSSFNSDGTKRQEIYPNMVLSIDVLQNRVRYPGPLNRSLSVRYLQNGETKYLSIPNWGYAVSPPNTKQEETSASKKDDSTTITNVNTDLIKQESIQTVNLNPKEVSNLPNDNKFLIEAKREKVKLALSFVLEKDALTQEKIIIDYWNGKKKIKTLGTQKDGVLKTEILVAKGDTLTFNLLTDEYGVFFKTRFIHDSEGRSKTIDATYIKLFSKSVPYVFSTSGKDSTYHAGYYMLTGDISLEALNRDLQRYYNTTASYYGGELYIRVLHAPNAERMEKFFKPRIKHFGIYPVNDKYKRSKTYRWWANSFAVKFYDETPLERIEYLLNQIGVKWYKDQNYKDEMLYYFSFNYLLDKSTTSKLEKLYRQKEIIYLYQETISLVYPD